MEFIAAVAPVMVLIFAALGIITMTRKFRGIPAQLGAQPYQYRVSRGKANALQLVSISVAVLPTMRFALRHYAWLDRVCDVLQIGVAERISDPEVDHLVVNESDDPLLEQALSSDPKFREHVLNLFQQPGVLTVRCAYGQLRLIRGPKDIARDWKNTDEAIAAEVASALLPDLAGLAEAIQAYYQRAGDTSRPSGLWRKPALQWLCICLGIAGGIAGFTLAGVRMPRQLSWVNIEHHAAVATSCGGAGLLALVMVALGNRASVRSLLLSVLFVATLGLWLAACAYYEVQNQRGDPILIDYRTMIVAKNVTRGRSTSYRIQVASWPSATLNRSLIVSSQLYNSLALGSCAHFELHHGNLGDMWLADAGPASACTGTAAH
jgi:hypothetical protein